MNAVFKKEVSKAFNKLEEEHHAMVFLIQFQPTKIQQMENDLLQRNDPFTKTVSDACRILAD